MKEFITKNIIGVAIGTFLSIQVIPSVTLSAYQTMMTPWRNTEEIERLEDRITAQDRMLREQSTKIMMLHDRLLSTE